MSLLPLTHFGRGMRYEFLPPYSPDFNPIELCFSALKARIKRNGSLFRELEARGTGVDVKNEIVQLLMDLVYTVTSEDALAWYRFCGYDY